MKSLYYFFLLALLLSPSITHSQKQRVFVASASDSIFGEAHNILISVDLSDCTHHYIDTLPVGMFTIALTSNSNLWAIVNDTVGAWLYQVDNAIGNLTYAGHFDTHGTYVQSLGVLNDSVLLIQCDSDLYGVTTTEVHSFRIGTVGNYHSGDMTWLGQDLYIIGYSDANPLNSRVVKVTFNNGSYPPIASATLVSNTPSLPYCSALATYILPNTDTALIGFADSNAYIINPLDGSYTLYCDILPDSLGHSADAASACYPTIPIILDTVNPTGIVSPSNKEIMVKVYPNPTSKEVNITYEGKSKATLILTDITGRTMLRQQLIKGTQQINVGQLTAGQYIAIIQTEDRTMYRQKIVKH